MTRAHDILFYDGHCGLCHRSVMFAMKRDPNGSRFRFAPLQGATFAATVSDETRRRLPDSIVVVTPEGGVLTRWRAVERLLEQLGGAWGVLARVARLAPRPLMNLGYDAVAAVRHRLFRKPEDVCPVCEAGLRERFLP